MLISRSVPSTARCLPFLLAGGRGSRLFELTDHTCKPAVGFGSAGGRIVDFILAALVAARFDRLFVATQYRPAELCRHLDRHWAHAFQRGIILRDGEVLSPHGYLGTADAVRVNARTLDAYGPREIMILSGDHVLDIDLEAFLRHHRSRARPVTVAATAVPLAEAGGFGIFDLNAEGEVTGFAEKPMRPSPMPGDPRRALASTGIYVFDWIWLKQALRDDPGRHDFGNDILPVAVRQGELGVYRLPDGSGGQGAYWRDVGTLDAYRLAQLDFAQPETPVPLPKTMGRLVTGPFDGMAEGTVLLPGSGLGRRCQLRNVIVGPGVRLPDGFRAGQDAGEDARWFRRTPGGTVLITAEMMARRESALRKTPERPLFRRTPRTPTLSTLKG